MKSLPNLKGTWLVTFLSETLQSDRVSPNPWKPMSSFIRVCANVPFLILLGIYLLNLYNNALIAFDIISVFTCI